MTRIRRPRGSWGLFTERKKRGVRFVALILVLVTLLCLRLCVLYSTSKFQVIAPSIEEKDTSRWAYAFLLADVDPEHPYYRGLLYNILVTSFSLKFDASSASKSRAEIVVLVQMASSSGSSKLPEEDFLKRMNVRVEYLNSSHASSSFYSLVLAKFEVLKLTEYSRVLFLDGDVLPLCSLDYLLDQSEKGVLRETVLHAMYEDPVNAGLFVVTPKPGYYQEIQDIIQRHGIPSKENWDSTIGWGKDQAAKNNEYRLWDLQKSGTGWEFYCADADQGLLLYWSKFVRQDVSIIVGPTVEQYTLSVTPTVTSTGELLPNSCLPPLSSSGRASTFAQNAGVYAASLPVYQDFFHMVGYSKAWEMPPKRSIPATRKMVESSSEYWYFLLQQVKDQFDVDNIIPPLDQLSVYIPKPRIRGDLFSTVEKNPGG